ncbi:hypothetical protein SMACR_12827 [Sordaria macrospora]|uniref:Uncharacterized protein n=1 Tax=Sordaria macrospora TaxID=5147 RepID=A0A8S9A4Y3_SORMA|nr:hypothetical protein SMACR_12827 [Sordaria macrospora]WPJ66820.1 hypothetical protein SMAC4_12827 [Sordaria macrospora]
MFGRMFNTVLRHLLVQICSFLFLFSFFLFFSFCLLLSAFFFRFSFLLPVFCLMFCLSSTSHPTWKKPGWVVRLPRLFDDPILALAFAFPKHRR